jgi:hypothetical protein
MVRLALWDGLLPLGMLQAPIVIRHLFPGQVHAGADLAAVILPIFAFIIRLAAGGRHFTSHSHQRWQPYLFVVAISVLVMFDGLSILFCLDPQVAGAAEWGVVGAFFGAYLMCVAIAFFPFPTDDDLKDGEVGVSQVRI